MPERGARLRGATEVHRWTYAFAGVALDLLKAGLPIFGALAWHESKPASCIRLLDGVLRVDGAVPLVRLWHDGNAARREVCQSGGCQHRASNRETTLERLRKQRDALTFTETSAETVKTAQDAVSTAT
jgi:hypothetical protein